MQKKQLPYALLIIGTGVIFAAGFLLGNFSKPESANSILDEAVNKIISKSSTQTDKETLERAAIEGMLRSLGDKWNQYLPETESTSFESVIEGQYSGIGIWLRSDDSGLVGVAGIVPSSPAEFANLEVGDLIQSIDGVSTQNQN